MDHQIICPHCGETTSSDNLNCIYCGEPLDRPVGFLSSLARGWKAWAGMGMVVLAIILLIWLLRN